MEFSRERRSGARARNETATISCKRRPSMTYDIEQAACPICGELIAAEAVDCPHCGSYLGEGGRMEGGAGADPALSWLIPIGRSGWAIAAGYLALFSIFPLIGLPFSLGAVISGILAVRSIRQHSKLTGLGRAWFGIVMGCLTLFLQLAMIAAVITHGRR